MEFNDFRLKFNCPTTWNSMDDLGDTKFCRVCEKKVYDFTNAKPQEFLDILAENNNNICGRFRQDQVAPAHHDILPAWKKWVSAALVLIGINLINNKVYAQIKVKAADKSQHVAAADSIPVVGKPILQGDSAYGYKSDPEFPGGPDALGRFISKNLHYRKDMVSGRVIASFTIEPTGRLSNFRIERGLSRANDNEVLRVLKRSPKWKPSVCNGKPLAASYAIPINFAKK